MEKTATDQTTTRSSKTRRITIQLPPLTGIYKVPGSGSLFARKPEKDIRQADGLLTAASVARSKMVLSPPAFSKAVD
jgi:hypothetical protein